MCEALAHALSARGLAEAEYAHQIGDITRGAATYGRSLVRVIYPVDLEAGGLVPALQELTANASQVFRVRCTLACEGPARLNDGAVAIEMFRIAQEAVNNAMKHAHADRVRVELASTEDRTVLSVHDNGVGLPEGD